MKKLPPLKFLETLWTLLRSTGLLWRRSPNLRPLVAVLPPLSGMQIVP